MKTSLILALVILMALLAGCDQTTDTGLALAPTETPPADTPGPDSSPDPNPDGTEAPTSPPVAPPSGPTTGSFTWYDSWDDAVALAKAENKLIVLSFYTDVCPWCTRLDKDVFSNEEVGAFLSNHFVPLKLNASRSSLSGTYDVRGVPTTVFVTADGAEIGESRIPGYAPAENFFEWLQEIQAFWEEQ